MSFPVKRSRDRTHYTNEGERQGGDARETIAPIVLVSAQERVIIPRTHRVIKTGPDRAHYNCMEERGGGKMLEKR